jgi:DtxR family Mn-dependent transcriptional regulator
MVRLRTELTTAQEDYLKALYHLGGVQRSVATSRLADRMGVSPASVTEMLGKLASLQLISYDRYHGAALTEKGEGAALEMVRHHRLVEMFLVEKLGYAWDEVHDEAERLEHVISERMEQRIFDVLGRPDLDPHGDPIPSLAGEIAATHYRRLTETQPGEQLTVRRVSDADAGKLRALEHLGLRLDVQLHVLDESEYEGPITVEVAGSQRQVPLGLAREVFVS